MVPGNSSPAVASRSMSHKKKRGGDVIFVVVQETGACSTVDQDIRQHGVDTSVQKQLGRWYYFRQSVCGAVRKEGGGLGWLSADVFCFFVVVAVVSPWFCLFALLFFSCYFWYELLPNPMVVSRAAIFGTSCYPTQWLRAWLRGNVSGTPPIACEVSPPLWVGRGFAFDEVKGWTYKYYKITFLLTLTKKDWFLVFFLVEGYLVSYCAALLYNPDRLLTERKKV